MKIKTLLLSAMLLVVVSNINAQPDRWQQKIAYTINVNMDVNTNRFSGTEKIDYYNNAKMFFYLLPYKYTLESFLKLEN